MRLLMSTSPKSIVCSYEDDNELKKGPWSVEEDDLLIKYIANHGEGRWNLLAIHSGLRRTGKSCRLRWLNYLKPDVKRGNLTKEEQLLIFELHSKWGNRWSKIARQLPGRTDNEIKNYWRTRIQKQDRYVKFDTDRTTRFLEFVKGLQMTRCLHKAQESSPSAVLIQDQAIPLLPSEGVSQYSSFEIGTTPTTQITFQRTCVNEGGPNYLNSDFDHNNGSSSSSESVNIQHMNQPLECTSSQFQALDSCDFGICSFDGYIINNNNAYDMDAFNLTTTMVAEDHKLPMIDCQISETNSLNKELACSTWNMDELWQFSNSQR